MSDNSKKIDKYLSEIIGEFKNEFLISNTGIIEVDSIINYKNKIL